MIFKIEYENDAIGVEHRNNNLIYKFESTSYDSTKTKKEV